MAKIVVKTQHNWLVLVEAKDQKEACAIVEARLGIKPISAWFEEHTAEVMPKMLKRVLNKDYVEEL